jgi:hypothetical protein
MTPEELLMVETRGLVKKWENCKLITDPKDFPVLTESFGVAIVDGVRHEFKSHEEREEFWKKQNKL